MICPVAIGLNTRSSGALRRVLFPIETALAVMNARVAAIAGGHGTRSSCGSLEHPPLYTAGTSAKPEELIEARFPGPCGRARRAVHLVLAPANGSPMAMIDLKRRSAVPTSGASC